MPGVFMKWFKHDSDAGSDAKLRKLRMKYGAQGYGIYWYCLELIARNVDKNNLTFELEHDADLIADDFKLSAELVQEMMTYMVNLGLFENVNGIITCLKMASRTDEYTQKLLAISSTCKTVGTLSGQNPEKSELIEENRTDKIRKEKNKTDNIPYGEIVDQFNEILKRLPSIRQLTDKRKKAIKSIWSLHNDYQNIEFYKIFFDQVNRYDFLFGENNSGWTASFDWIFNKNNFIKILEGNYESKNDRSGAVQAIFGKQVVEKDITNDSIPF